MGKMNFSRSLELLVVLIALFVSDDVSFSDIMLFCILINVLYFRWIVEDHVKDKENK